MTCPDWRSVPSSIGAAATASPSRSFVMIRVARPPARIVRSRRSSAIPATTLPAGGAARLAGRGELRVDLRANLLSRPHVRRRPDRPVMLRVRYRPSVRLAHLLLADLLDL